MVLSVPGDTLHELLRRTEYNNVRKQVRRQGLYTRTEHTTTLYHHEAHV
jgi:hypothetical protein